MITLCGLTEIYAHSIIREALKINKHGNVRVLYADKPQTHRKRSALRCSHFFFYKYPPKRFCDTHFHGTVS